MPFVGGLLGSIKSISGHALRYSEALKHDLPGGQFIVFVRDPIDRIISLYFHMLKKHPGLRFFEWARNYNGPDLSNFQTRFIAGEDNIELATRILRHGYSFVASLEKFDPSLILLGRMLGPRFDLRYERKRTSRRDKEEVLGNEENCLVLEKLREHNRSDLKLHEYVKTELFEHYQEYYGPVDAGQVDLLREANNSFRFSQTRIWAFQFAKHFFYRFFFLRATH
jgi:hypothetical protein